MLWNYNSTISQRGGFMKKALTSSLTTLFLIPVFCSFLFAGINDGLVGYYPFNGNGNNGNEHGGLT